MPNKSDKNPPGFSLIYTLPGHTQNITQIAWSPDGRILASPSEDRTILLWDIKKNLQLQPLTEHTDSVHSISWSPDGSMLASSSDDRTIKLWERKTGQCLATLTGHKAGVRSVAYAPNGQFLASGSSDGTIKLWKIQTGQCLATLIGHKAGVRSVAYAPNGQFLASGSSDEKAILWDTHVIPFLPISRAIIGMSMAWSPDGQFLAVGSTNGIIDIMKVRDKEPLGANKNILLVLEAHLEGHTDLITSLSFSSSGQLLASKSRDSIVRLWRTDDWKTIAVINESASENTNAGLAFHPTKPVLATLGEEDMVIRIWDLDIPALLDMRQESPSFLYRNAKVVLVGDSGVGKSALGLVLTEQPFVPTESTHSRHVWTLENNNANPDAGNEEIREILLWDLAGQPGYRLIHQLHLNEVALALVLMDARSETDPFAGVHHWDRALRVAQRSQSHPESKLKKFLVSARIDRGGLQVSRQRIEALIRDRGFDNFFETSAKEGWGIGELAEAIKKAIVWDTLPKISSTELFQEIKTFLVAEKEAGRILSQYNELYQAFLRRQIRQHEDLQAGFETCIEQMETQGLIRRLSVDNFVLLQPEFIDAYASALVNAVRDEPDGLGSIEEERVRVGDFSMPVDERLPDSDLERHLLTAMIEDLLRNEIALRERTFEGTYLVFPSQTTRENPEMPDPELKMVIFRFDGPIQNIYATLAVRLSHSGLFELKELWRNAITFKSETGGTCGLILHNLSEGRAELTLFFDTLESEEISLHFENYVQEHLRHRALADSIEHEHIFACSNCGVQFTPVQVLRRRQRGFNTIICSVCETHISIVDRDQELYAKSLVVVSAMNRSADAQREHEVTASMHSSSRHQNPYYEMSGMHNPGMFVGRAELLRRLFSAVANKQSISLVGKIRIGKTSLLQHMSRSSVQRHFDNKYDFRHHLFVLLDLGEFIYKTSEEFLQAASKNIVSQSRGTLELPKQGSGADTFEAILRQGKRQGFHTVLLMDSFDNIVRNKSFDPGFLEFLRSMVSKGVVSYVTTSSAPLAEICHDALVSSPFFNIFGTYELGTLTLEEAQQLVSEPSRLAGCPFTKAEIAWALSLAGRHPFFIQRVCYFLFEEKIAGDGTTDLSKVKGQVYNDFLPHFNYIWERLNTLEQGRLTREEVLSVDVQRRQFPELSESDLFRDFVQEKTGSYFFQLNSEELEKALQYLDDPIRLGTSRLRYLISVSMRLKVSSAPTAEVGRAIREVLKEALERLGGNGTRTDTSSDWLSYNILYYRYFYIDHSSIERIAARIGFSTRQYYRARGKAIERLLNALLETEALAKTGVEA